MTDDNNKALDLRTPACEDDFGTIDELPPKDRARLALAYWVLGASVVLMVGAAFGLVLVSDDRLNEAKTLWEFSKTFCPPVITLVIGFYFRQD